jgi:glycosyltransferase involved in cell wall biosynthesis
MTEPIVTVVVPIYNGSAYLAETINSLLSQTFGNFELLAVDDGSTDASSDIVRSFKDQRVRLIQKENGGLCKALNLGIREATAPYIARSDQDDISLPVRLERQLQVMEDHPEAIGLFTYNTKFGGKRRWSNTDKLAMAAGELKEYEPIKDGCMLGSTMFARTAALRAIGGFRQEYYPVDDWDLEFRLAEAGKVLILREPLVAYRFQTSANTYRVFADMRQKSRWAKDSHRRRAQFVPELAFDQFMLSQPQDMWSRMGRRRRDSSKLHMRAAGQRFLDGCYLAAAGHLLAAVLLDPADMARRARRYFIHS